MDPLSEEETAYLVAIHLTSATNENDYAVHWKQLFRLAQRRWHPDRCNSIVATRVSQLLNQADKYFSPMLHEEFREFMQDNTHWATASFLQLIDLAEYKKNDGRGDEQTMILQEEINHLRQVNQDSSQINQDVAHLNRELQGVNTNLRETIQSLELIIESMKREAIQAENKYRSLNIANQQSLQQIRTNQSYFDTRLEEMTVQNQESEERLAEAREANAQLRSELEKQRRQPVHPHMRRYCPFCRRPGHAASQCTAINNLAARLIFVNATARPLCYKCLSFSHRSSTCPSDTNCRLCDLHHHTALCYSTLHNSPPLEEKLCPSCLQSLRGRHTTILHCQHHNYSYHPRCLPNRPCPFCEI